ncbi:MAG: copper chaperone PCu(A)C, partial [Nitrospiraceae bacterium]
MFFITPAALLQAASPLTVHNPWVLESPPGMKVMAAYMNLTNESEKDRIITAVSSPDFNRVE